MNSPITPLGDRAVIKKEEKSESMHGGIVLPAGTEANQSIGVILAVGEGKRNDAGELVPLGVREGQKVLFSWGEKVEIQGEEYHVVSESNILGVIKQA